MRVKVLTLFLSLTLIISVNSMSSAQVASGTLNINQSKYTGYSNVTSGSFASGSTYQAWAKNKSSSYSYGSTVSIIKYNGFGGYNTISYDRNINGNSTAYVTAGVFTINYPNAVKWTVIPALN